MLGISTRLLSLLEKTSEKQEPGLEGKTRRFSDAQIAFVFGCYQSYSSERKRVKIEAFMKDLRSKWKDQSWLTPAPSRKTVEDMLVANGLRKPKAGMTNGSKMYYPSVDRYFPHAQAVLDGKEVVVRLNRNDYPFTLEFSKDIATSAIGGSAVSTSETAEVVKQAFHNHSRQYGRPVAALIDNGKGNLKAAVDLGSEGTLFIKAWPGRPETKGHIEGEFGVFEKKVSHIVIEGETDQEQAMSILENVSEVYLRLRNQTPRCSDCPFTPETLMKAKLGSVEAGKAYEVFKEQKQIKEKQKQKRLKISEKMKELVESVVREHRLTGDLLRFKRSLRWIEISTLKEAERAFAVQSGRDTFDPAKRTMAYLFAIARNMQIQKDQERREQTARRRYQLSESAKENRKKVQAALEMQKEKQILEKQPHLKLINAMKADMNLPESFRATITIFKNQMDQAILSIIRKKTQRRQSLIEKTHESIMEISYLSLETRYNLIKQVNERINLLSNGKVKVVTPK